MTVYDYIASPDDEMLVKAGDWEFDVSDMTAVCGHGNSVEWDGTCPESDCRNPLA